MRRKGETWWCQGQCLEVAYHRSKGYLPTRVVDLHALPVTIRKGEDRGNSSTYLTNYDTSSTRDDVGFLIPNHRKNRLCYVILLFLLQEMYLCVINGRFTFVSYKWGMNEVPMNICSFPGRILVQMPESLACKRIKISRVWCEVLPGVTKFESVSSARHFINARFDFRRFEVDVLFEELKFWVDLVCLSSDFIFLLLLLGFLTLSSGKDRFVLTFFDSWEVAVILPGDTEESYSAISYKLDPLTNT